MITIEHISLLLQIQTSENPNWGFLSNNYPEGMLWDPAKVASLLNDLRKARMVEQIDTEANILLLPAGEKEIARHLGDQKKKEQTLKLDFEKLSLEVDKLRNDFFDYSATKSRAKWSFKLSIVAVFISVIIPLLQIMCNRRS